MKASHTTIQGSAHNKKAHLYGEVTLSPHRGAQHMQLVHLFSAWRATSAPEKSTSQYKSARVDDVAHPIAPATYIARRASQCGPYVQPEADTHPLCGLWRSCVGPMCRLRGHSIGFDPIQSHNHRVSLAQWHSLPGVVVSTCVSVNGHQRNIIGGRYTCREAARGVGTYQFF